MLDLIYHNTFHVATFLISVLYIFRVSPVVMGNPLGLSSAMCTSISSSSMSFSALIMPISMSPYSVSIAIVIYFPFFFSSFASSVTSTYIISALCGMNFIFCVPLL